MTTETERTALVERHVLALMDDGSPSGPDECRYVTLAMARSAIAAAVTEALASAPSAPQPTEEPSIEGLVMTAQHYLGADFGTPPPDKRASFLLAAIHHLGGALRGMVEAYTAKRDAYERMRANYEMSAEARAVRSIAAMLGWENVPPQDVLEDDIRALKARVQEAQPSPAPPDPIAAAVDAQLDPLKDELIAMGHTLAKETK